VVLCVKKQCDPVEDAECSGCPSKSETADTVDQLKELVLENRRVITPEVADMLGVLFSSVQSLRSSFFWDVTHWKVWDNLSVHADLTKPEFLLVIVTGDETWVYSYEKEVKQQPQWNSPSSPCPRQDRFAEMWRAWLFISHHLQSSTLWICSTKITVNQHYYIEKLQCL